MRYYDTGDRPKRYTRDEVDKFVKKTRNISSKKDFTEYHLQFLRRAAGLEEEITQEDMNGLFWKGIPEEDVQSDTYNKLRVRQTSARNRNRTKDSPVHPGQRFESQPT